jgi:hypothetical protein
MARRVDTETFDASLHDANIEAMSDRRMGDHLQVDTEAAEGIRDSREAILHVGLHRSLREQEGVGGCALSLEQMAVHRAECA